MIVYMYMIFIFRDTCGYTHQQARSTTFRGSNTALMPKSPAHINLSDLFDLEIRIVFFPWVWVQYNVSIDIVVYIVYMRIHVYVCIYIYIYDRSKIQISNDLKAIYELWLHVDPLSGSLDFFVNRIVFSASQARRWMSRRIPLFRRLFVVNVVMFRNRFIVNPLSLVQSWCLCLCQCLK